MRSTTQIGTVLGNGLEMLLAKLGNGQVMQERMSVNGLEMLTETRASGRAVLQRM